MKRYYIGVNYMIHSTLGANAITVLTHADIIK